MARPSHPGRIALLGGTLLIAAPAIAAPPGNVIAIPPPDQRGEERVVGPEQLRDFQLGEERQQRPTPEPQPAPSVPATPPPAAPTRQAPLTLPRPSASTPSAPIVAPPPPSASPIPVSPPVEVDPVADDPVAPSVSDTPSALAPRPLADDDFKSSAAAPGWWLLVLLPLIAVGAAFMAFRRRLKTTPAPVAASPAASPAVPQPDRAPVTPEPLARANPFADLEPPARRSSGPAAEPAPAAPTGIITTTLRPQIEMRVVPLRAAVEAEEIWIEYRVDLKNTGNGSAFDLGVDGGLVNAGPDQAGAVETLFDRAPGADGAPVLPELSPGGSVQLQGRARRKLAEVRVLQAGDRRIAAPLLALRLTRSVRRGGQGVDVETQLYFVGRSGGSEGRLAPIRVDTGPRLIRDAILKPA